MAEITAQGHLLACNRRLLGWTTRAQRQSLQTLLPQDEASWRAALRAVVTSEVAYARFVGNLDSPQGIRCVRGAIARDETGQLRVLLEDLSDLITAPPTRSTHAALQGSVDGFIDQLAREGDFDSAMNSLLVAIGQALGVDRSFLFIRNPRGSFDNTHEWCAPDIASQREQLQGIELAEFPFISQYLQNRLLFSSHVRQLPPEAHRERETLASQGIRSVMLCPVLHLGVLTGFIGFDAVRAEREWTPEEKQTLRMLANVIGSQIALQSASRDRLQALAQLNELLETAPVVIYRTPDHDADQRFADYISPVAETLSGYPTEQLRETGFWKSLIHPDDIAAVEARNRQLLTQGRVSLEYRVRRADGVWRWIRDDLVRVTRETDGRSYLVGYVVDITEQREQQVMLVQASKMATLGEMSTNLAHELNQPLSTIAMSLDNLEAAVLSERPPGREALEKRLARIQRQVKRAADIIDHMRIFGRRSDAPPEPFSPNEAVRGALDLVRAQFRLRGIDTEFRPCEESAQVLGEQSQLEQVLLNLLINARDAIEERRTRNGGRELAGRILIQCQWPGEGLPMKLGVRDNGGGIPERVLARIFEPFYSTKPAGKGTGLGLPISYGIVRDMGGDITCENVEDGALFQIRLPVIHTRRATAA